MLFQLQQSSLVGDIPNVWIMKSAQKLPLKLHKNINAHRNSVYVNSNDEGSTWQNFWQMQSDFRQIWLISFQCHILSHICMRHLNTEKPYLSCHNSRIVCKTVLLQYLWLSLWSSLNRCKPCMRNMKACSSTFWLLETRKLKIFRK